MGRNQMRQAPDAKTLDRLTEKLRTGAGTVDSIGAELRLTKKQIHWAKLYAQHGHEWTITRITMEAYPDCSYPSAAIQGGQNKAHPCILCLLDMIFVVSGVSDLSLYKEIVKTLHQNDSYPAKIQAARTILEVTGRLNDQLKITINQGIDVSKLPTELLQQIEDHFQSAGLIEIEGRTIENRSGDDIG